MSKDGLVFFSKNIFFNSSSLDIFKNLLFQIHYLVNKNKLNKSSPKKVLIKINNEVERDIKTFIF